MWYSGRSSNSSNREEVYIATGTQTQTQLQLQTTDSEAVNDAWELPRIVSRRLTVCIHSIGYIVLQCIMR